MSAQKHPNESANRCASLTLPELVQSKIAVLDILASAHSRRAYNHAIEKFIAWYCAGKGRRCMVLPTGKSG